MNNLNTVFEEEYNRRRQLAEETNETLINLTNTINATDNLANIVGLNSSQRLIQFQELAKLEHKHKLYKQNIDN